MKFLDNSLKTNWKYIALVIFLAFFVGGGIILWHANSVVTSDLSKRAVRFVEKETTDWEKPIDIVQCKPGTKRFLYHGLGSKEVEVKGREGNQCIFEFTDEIEGGYTINECRAEISLKEISLSSFNFLEFCKVIKSGNMLLENQELNGQDVAQWQTYRNEEFGFEVRYPKGWVVTGDDRTGEDRIENQQTNSSLSIIKNDNPENLSLDEWFREATLINGRPTVKAAAKPVTINGVKAYRVDAELPSPNPYFEVVGIADEQRHIFTIHANYKVIEDGEILDQILSTFRFIE